MRRVRTLTIMCLLWVGAWQAGCEVKQVQLGSPSADVTLTPSEWSLVELDGKPVIGLSQTPTLVLAEDGKTNGFAGCNRFTGTYTLEADQLTFSPLVATRMFCTDAMELEQQYLAALGGTRRLKQRANRLELAGDAGVIARLERR
jgi:heat shock protein HslJ